MGILNHNERIGVDIHDRPLQFCDLLLFYHREDDLFTAVAVSPFSMQIGNAPIQIFLDHTAYLGDTVAKIAKETREGKD